MNAPTMTVDSFKPYIFPVVSVVVVIALIPLLALPWIGDIQNQWKINSDKRAKVAALESKVKALSDLDAQQDKTNLASVEPVVPSLADPAGLLGTVEQVAISSGTSTRGVHYGQSSARRGKKAKVETIGTNLSITGGYANIVDFIRQSENAARVLSLESLHIVPSSDDKTSLIATFDLISPYEPLPTDLGAAEDPLPEKTAPKLNALNVANSLQRAPYAATPGQEITGKENPF